jgi:hypothetical protein
MNLVSPRPTAIDPSRCPLCGDENDCGMAKGNRACWCHTMTIPQEVLARVPLEAQGIACVCRACATGRPNSEDLVRRIEALTRR